MNKQEFKNMPFKKKWEHYWFYYKWHTIIAAVAVILVGYSIFSAVTQTKYDIYIDMMCKDVTYDIAENIGKTLENTDAVKDINGDGEKHVSAALIALSYESNAQDVQMLQAVQVRMYAGESTVIMASKDFIKGYGGQGVFADITDIADECNIPQDMRYVDENGATTAIRLFENKFMMEHGTPAEDSYIALRTMTHDHKKDEEKVKEHESAVEVIKYILNYN